MKRTCFGFLVLLMSSFAHAQGAQPRPTKLEIAVKQCIAENSRMMAYGCNAGMPVEDSGDEITAIALCFGGNYTALKLFNEGSAQLKYVDTEYKNFPYKFNSHLSGKKEWMIRSFSGNRFFCAYEKGTEEVDLCLVRFSVSVKVQ
jgi:hypothetical protein